MGDGEPPVFLRFARFSQNYDKPDLLGPAVIAKWHNLEYDIVEAGNCYAMGRCTAMVFHLMRVMEFGVQELGVKLGVALERKELAEHIG